MAGLFNYVYYRITHPWSAITLKYPILENISFCPKISTYEEDFDFEVNEEEWPKPIQKEAKAKGIVGPWM